MKLKIELRIKNKIYLRINIFKKYLKSIANTISHILYLEYQLSMHNIRIVTHIRHFSFAI